MIIRALLKPIQARLRRPKPTSANLAVDVPADNTNPLVAPAFRALVTTSRPVLLVFGESDRLFWEFEDKFLRRHGASLAPYAAWYRVHVTPQANHIFSSSEWQDDLFDQCCTWLERRASGTGAASPRRSAQRSRRARAADRRGTRMIYCALLLFFVFEYLRPGAYVPGLDALHLNGLIPLTCIFGTLVRKTPVSNREFFAELNTKLMGTLLALLVVSTAFATVTMTAYSVLTTVLAYILIYWVLVRQIGDLRRLKGVFITLTMVHIMIAALNPAVFSSTENRVGINSGAFLGDGNDFSLSVNICIPLCLFLMAESKKKI